MNGKLENDKEEDGTDQPGTGFSGGISNLGGGSLFHLLYCCNELTM
jgi:hypothetical protein